jgi:hypothetical protein
MTTPAPVPAPQPAPEPPWVPSRKVLTQFTANVLTLGVALVAAHFGLHETSGDASVVSAGIGIAAGGIAGYLVKEIPRLEAEAGKPAATKM